MSFESQLGLLNHLSKLEQNSESSETSSVEKIDDGREPFDENDENPSSKHKCELCYLSFNESAELSQHLMVRKSGKVKAYVSTSTLYSLHREFQPMCYFQEC